MDAVWTAAMISIFFIKGAFGEGSLTNSRAFSIPLTTSKGHERELSGIAPLLYCPKEYP